MRDFSEHTGHLKYLQALNLRGCLHIVKFPQLPGNIRHLNLSNTEINAVPSSIENLCSLEKLEPKNCIKLELFKLVFVS